MTKALIAVRSGSVRVKNKNMRPFAKKTLLEYKIEQLKRLSCLDGIVVNSNDIEMLALSASLGCETIMREERFASSNVSMSEVYINMAENFPGDIIVYSNVTNPLIKDETIKQAVEMFLHNRDHIHSVNTAHVVKEFLYLDEKPLNYNPENQPRSQDLPDIYALNFAINVIAREDMIRYANVIAPSHHLLAVTETEAVDIDSMLDFRVAEYLFEMLKDELGYHLV